MSHFCFTLNLLLDRFVDISIVRMSSHGRMLNVLRNDSPNKLNDVNQGCFGHTTFKIITGVKPPLLTPKPFPCVYHYGLRPTFGPDRGLWE